MLVGFLLPDCAMVVAVMLNRAASDCHKGSQRVSDGCSCHGDLHHVSPQSSAGRAEPAMNRQGRPSRAASGTSSGTPRHYQRRCQVRTNSSTNHRPAAPIITPRRQAREDVFPRRGPPLRRPGPALRAVWHLPSGRRESGASRLAFSRRLR
jgi:hypothetical protein